VSSDPPSKDPWAEAAALIGDAAKSAEHARRYRALADSIAEDSFERTLAIGSEMRAAARRGTPDALAVLVAELHELVARCQAGIAEVRASGSYRAAVRAFTNGETARVATLACAIFSNVIAGRHEPHTLYWPVPVLGGRSVEHFLPPIDCAVRIDTLRREGIPAVAVAPERGGDEDIRPVLLSERHEESESPFALALASSALPGPVCRLVGSETTLFYAPHLVADFTVSCASGASDEWWRVRPNAYHTYLNELQESLRARGIAVVIEPDAREG
jgi:hypothetical protein